MEISAESAFDSRDAGLTLAYQNELLRCPVYGEVAFGVFRAAIRSSRAKSYGRRRTRSKSYDGKNEALVYLCRALERHAESLEIPWGWGRDPKAIGYEHVLYVDLPGFGQVSHHSRSRYCDRDYPYGWDGQRETRPRTIAFCDWALETEHDRLLDHLCDDSLMPFGKFNGTAIGETDKGYRDWLSKWEGITGWPAVHGWLQAQQTAPAVA